MIPQIVSSFVICLLFSKFIDYNGALTAVIYRINPAATVPNFLRDPAVSFNTVIFYMIWSGFGTSVIIFSNAMKEVNDEILESARVDGVHGMFQELFHIVLPLIYPTLSTFLITGFAGFLVVTGPNIEFYMYDAPREVYNVGYFYVRQTMVQSENYYPVLAAGGLLMTVVIAPFTHLVKRFLDKHDPQGD
jgi:ABC-type sugar transport system permease subunit